MWISLSYNFLEQVSFSHTASPEVERFAACCKKLYFVSYISIKVWGGDSGSKGSCLSFLHYPFSSPSLEVINRILDWDYAL